MLKRFTDMVSEYRDESRPLIYQMGKVGSTMLEHSLKGAINIHTLYANSTCPPHFNIQRRGVKGWVRYELPFYFKRWAIKRRTKVNIVSVVRDPIARNRSMYFQDLAHWLSAYIRQFDANAKTEGLDLLIECYRDFFNHDYAEHWFDNEIRRLTGIDIFKHGFTPGQAQVIENQKYRLFVVRLEDLESNLQALSDFLGQSIKPVSANRGEKKWYGDLYKTFVKQCPLLDQEKTLYQGKTARHFQYKNNNDKKENTRLPDNLLR